MKLFARIAAVLVLLMLASPVMLLKGCGAINGGACGGCPDSPAPFGSTVSGADATYSIQSAPGATTVSYCVNSMIFTFKDPNGQPLNDICAEVFTNGLVALSAGTDCTTNFSTNGGFTYIRTRTNAGGTVTLDFESNLITKGTSTTSTVTNFVQVTSCTASATSHLTANVTWQ